MVDLQALKDFPPPQPHRNEEEEQEEAAVVEFIVLISHPWQKHLQALYSPPFL